MKTNELMKNTLARLTILAVFGGTAIHALAADATVETIAGTRMRVD